MMGGGFGSLHKAWDGVKGEWQTQRAMWIEGVNMRFFLMFGGEGRFVVP